MFAAPGWSAIEPSSSSPVETAASSSVEKAGARLKKPVLDENMPVTRMDAIVVVGQLDRAREEIVPSLGATRYTIGAEQIASQSQGEFAPLNQTLLRLPGVAEDSFGQLHVRGEH